MPAFHAFASENEAMRWDFFVRHYADDAQQRRDPKYLRDVERQRVDGVFYPRAGTLGGCTAHNAMIFVYPHNADWDEHRRAHRRSIVARRADARATSSGSRTAGTAAVERCCAALGINPTPPRLVRLAAHRARRARGA